MHTSFAVSLVAILAAVAAPAAVWEPKPAAAGAPTNATTARIVAYADEWSRHGVGGHGAGQCAWRSSYNALIGDTNIDPFTRVPLDVDGDGNATDDFVGYQAFSLDQPLSIRDWPHGGVFPHRRNATYYGGVAWYVAHAPLTHKFVIEHGINCDHDGPYYDPRAEDHPLNGQPDSSNPASFHKHYYCILWKKADFMNGADAATVSFDTNSLLSVGLARYWYGFDDIGLVVNDGGQYFIAERNFFADTSVAEACGWTNLYRTYATWTKGRIFRLNPTTTQWAPYHPGGYNIQFNRNGASYAPHTFTDVQAVGWYLAKTNTSTSMSHTKWYTFDARATITKPYRPSEKIDMARIPAAAGVPEFYISTCEVPYLLWQDGYRYGTSPSYGYEPRHCFLKNGDMGSMQYGATAHAPEEPAVNVTLYDAAVWCNTLSEMEGKVPCYYTDPTCTNIFRGHEFACYATLNNTYNERNFLNPTYANIPPPALYVKWPADGYRLPTPAEWSAAFQAGPTSPTGPTNQTHAVGSGPTNVFGLHDMLGNAWELAWPFGTAYTPLSNAPLVALGGGFEYPRDPRTVSASPYGDNAYDGHFNIGLRLVCRASGAAAPATGSLPAGSDYFTSNYPPTWLFGPTNLTRATDAATNIGDHVLQMLSISSGTFVRVPDNTAIRINPLYAAKYETTYAQWKRVYFWAIANGYDFDGDGDMGSMAWFTNAHTASEPVTGITWDDMVVWCNALSEMEGKTPVYYTNDACTIVLRKALRYRPIRLDAPTLYRDPYPAYLRVGERERWIFPRWDSDGYRLPTAAEWEYLARAGTQSAYFWGSSLAGRTNFVWDIVTAGATTHPVGQLQPNPFGLCDIQGNVFETLWSIDGNDVATREYLDDKNNPKASRYWAYQQPKEIYGPKKSTMMAGSSWFWGSLNLNDSKGAIRTEDGFFPHPDVGFRVVRGDAGIQPRDGNYPLEPIILLNYNAVDFDPLQDQVPQGSLHRNGIFNQHGAGAAYLLKWKFKTGGAVKAAPIVVPVVVTGVTHLLVLVGSLDSNFYALSASDGTEQWHFASAGGIEAGACLYSNAVYFSALDGNVYALQATNGTQKWRANPASSSAGLRSTPAAAYNTVFVNVAGTLTGFRADSGGEFWAARSGYTPHADVPTAVTLTSNRLLYAHSAANTFRVVDLDSGIVTAKATGPGQYSRSSVATLNGTAYPAWAGNIGGAPGYSSLNSIRLADLNVNWGVNIEAHLPQEQRMPCYASPSVWSNTVYVGCDSGFLYAYNTANGALRWRCATSNAVRTAPAISAPDGALYVGSRDGTLYALNALTGTQLWAFATGGPIDSTPFIHDGCVYFGSDDGYVYCLAAVPEPALLPVALLVATAILPHGRLIVSF